MDRGLLILGGLGLLAYGATRRAPTACVVGSVGLGLMAVGALNFDRPGWLSDRGHRAGAAGWGEHGRGSRLVRSAESMVTGA
jgi:hypothetical protein